MKFFLIATGLVVTLVIVGISQISNISMSLLEKAQAIEGGTAGKEAFDKLKLESPGEFRQKYEEAFKFRVWSCTLSFYLAEDEAFKLVAENTRELYLGTEFDKEDKFAVLLHRCAKTYEDRQPNVYHDRLVEVQEHFPNASIKIELERQIKLIKVRLNIAFARPLGLFC